MIRQLLTESLLLAAVGGALGILVGYWGKQLLPGRRARRRRSTGACSRSCWRSRGVTGIVFGIAPALARTGGDVNAALKQSSRSVAGSRSILGKSLLIAQVAISLVLLVGAGLFLRTLHNLRHVDVGFNPQNLLLFRVQPQLNRYDQKRTSALYGQHARADRRRCRASAASRTHEPGAAHRAASTRRASSFAGASIANARDSATTASTVS